MIQKQHTQLGLDPKFTKKVRIAIIRPTYHEALNGNMEKYCIATLLENGVKDSNIQTFLVPGSWELPLMVQSVAESKKFDAIVVFGIIVKGETYHFEMIANEVSTALMQLSLEYSIPVVLEVLAVYKKEQAEIRAGSNEYNKGIEAAGAALKMLEALQ